MICPNYKEQVIAALLKSKGQRQMRQLLEYDYDINKIITCDENECSRWKYCTQAPSNYFTNRREDL